MVVVHKHSVLHVLMYLLQTHILHFGLRAIFVSCIMCIICISWILCMQYALWLCNAKFAHPALHLLSLHATYSSLGKSSETYGIFMTFTIREEVNEKKTFSFGHCPNYGGVYPCPNFLALFQEVHFWSIKK